MNSRYFDWIKRCRDIMFLSSGPDDFDSFLLMCNDVNWFGCYDDGLTPEQAVGKFQRAQSTTNEQ